jgi:NADPH:quinone reductase-like Zn-dependent oxidoreductase
VKAIVQDAYGSPDVLQLRDVDVPDVGSDEVLLRVLAASVHIGDWHIMTGLPYLIRLVVPDLGLRAPKTRIRGMDVAGRIEAVGTNVTDFQPDDEVYGVCKGSFAGFASAGTDKLAPKPANLTFAQAAACPISGLAALQAVRDKGRVKPGQKVLVIGAGGAVGTFAVQVAKAFGANVSGVCSSSKVDLVRSLGADDVIDYTRGEFAESGHRYDVIIDTAGARSVPLLRRALSPKGTLVIVGSEGGGRWFGGFGATSGHRCCRRSSPRKWGCSLRRRMARTWSPSRSSSRPPKSRRLSVRRIRSPGFPTPCVAWKRVTPEERSSSPSKEETWTCEGTWRLCSAGCGSGQ